MEQPHIVFIDDNPLITEAYTNALESAGFKVSAASNGEEGLSLVRLQKPQVVLLDLLLHGVDGMEVLRELKQDPEMANTHVIIFTMRETEALRKEALELGAVAYYLKSELSIAQLVKQIEIVLTMPL